MRYGDKRGISVQSSPGASVSSLQIVGSRTSLPGMAARSRSPGQASHISKRPG